ncbi:uncharacterized protein LOC122246135 isoform X1 [Penaeus japonicus]|uniref:uncharacterized protein LOC122246135 isoform X1 n=2 Tax=Penaeus japonicus TaxID=27405 RepID=UPI001C7160B5|nr:uncharacterized protein LOC122246135 isoform X1 [Penaeus japonicus]
MRAFIRDHRNMAVSDWSGATAMVGDRRHPLLAQMPAPPTHAQRPGMVGVPGVGVKLMQEPGFAAHDSHLYAHRDLQQASGGVRYREDHSASSSSASAQGLRYFHMGAAATGGAVGEDEGGRRQRALSPGSQHSAAATFFAR